MRATCGGDIILEWCPARSRTGRGFGDRRKTHVTRRRGQEPAPLAPQHTRYWLRQFCCSSSSNVAFPIADRVVLGSRTE
jgi:hypothetical protein